MDDQNHDTADHSYRVPTLFSGSRIGLRQGERIIENKLGGFEADAVFPLVDAVLVGSPRPVQRSILM